MAKAQDAFRTISEVSETLDTPAHVLRFWESKFSQVKPVKRAGGRRYYRPDDLALLSGIKKLLHEQGMTIKGAQKLIREKGIKHVVGLGEDALDVWSDDAIDGVAEAKPQASPEPDIITAPETKAAEPEPAPMEEVAAAEPEPVVAAEKVAKPQVAAEATETVTPPPVAPPGGLSFAATPPSIAGFSPPATPKVIPARFFDAYARADHDQLRARAKEIAPLLARLEAIHAKMVQR